MDIEAGEREREKKRGNFTCVVKLAKNEINLLEGFF